MMTDDEVRKIINELKNIDKRKWFFIRSVVITVFSLILAIVVSNKLI